MSILPISLSQRVIPLNEASSLDNVPMEGDDPALESDDEEFDTIMGAINTLKPTRVPFYEKWRRKLLQITYQDLKITGLWLVESAKCEFSISVRATNLCHSSFYTGKILQWL